MADEDDQMIFHVINMVHREKCSKAKSCGGHTPVLGPCWNTVYMWKKDEGEWFTIWTAALVSYPRQQGSRLSLKLYTSHFNSRAMSFWKQLVLFVGPVWWSIVGHVVKMVASCAKIFFAITVLPLTEIYAGSTAAACSWCKACKNLAFMIYWVHMLDSSIGGSSL